MTADLFLIWIKHFVKHTSASLTNKVLLILDGHSSHKSIDALEYASDHGVVVLCLPPHSTHRLQPLDRSFFDPLMTYYDYELACWMKQNPGEIVPLSKVSSLFGKAYSKAATLAIAVRAFECCGIYPFNRDVFPDTVFAPAGVTDRPICVRDASDVQQASSASVPTTPVSNKSPTPQQQIGSEPQSSQPASIQITTSPNLAIEDATILENMPQHQLWNQELYTKLQCQ